MDEAAAWDAISARLATVYPGQEPKHWGTVQRYAEGGPDPLDGVSAYWGSDPPFWHYISFGMTSWGFEFSFRLLRGWETEPPLWPVTFLQTLGSYVNNTGCPFAHEHYISWGGPITNVQPTDKVALVFATDPVFGSVAVGAEALAMLSPIAITEGQFAVCAQDRPEEVLKALHLTNPKGVVSLI
jgi:suppressor of fused-like protein